MLGKVEISFKDEKKNRKRMHKRFVPANHYANW